MYILIDHRIPDDAKKCLSRYGEIIEIPDNTITYNAISSHPDIFCCQTPDNLIIAPNSPSNIIENLYQKKIKFVFGEQKIGMQYPQSSHYNAVVTENYLIHTTSFTDRIISENCNSKIKISVNQGYTRCNLINLGENKFITSDAGIYKQLCSHNDISIIYLNPDKILLPGVKNGFFGGCCGFFQHKLFVNGNINYLKESQTLKEFLIASDIQLIELYNGPLYDGGSIFFIEC